MKKDTGEVSIGYPSNDQDDKYILIENEDPLRQPVVTTAYVFCGFFNTDVAPPYYVEGNDDPTSYEDVPVVFDIQIVDADTGDIGCNFEELVDLEVDGGDPIFAKACHKRNMDPIILTEMTLGGPPCLYPYFYKPT